MRLCLGVFLIVLLGCDVTLPHPTTHGSGGASVSIAYEPDSPSNSLPPVVWIELHSEGTTLTTADAVLVRGAVSATQLRELARDQPSAALVESFVPVTSFIRDEKLVLAPTAPLADGSYTVALGRLSTTSEITVSAPAREFPMKRIWPPFDLQGSPAALVYCGIQLLPNVSIPATLEPSGFSGSFTATGDAAFGRRCFYFHPDASPSTSGTLFVPPPAISSGQRSWMLDPTPLSLATEALSVDPVSCQGAEVSFGPACVLVDDDRLMMRPPAAPLFWTLVGADLDRRLVSRENEPLVVKGLRPDSALTLSVTTMDVLGRTTETTFAATTKAAHPHVVVNEEYANPLGPEPTQEWVELYNDGLVDAELGGMTLADIGGSTVLPEAVLPAGAFALVVPAAFAASDGVDPQPPPDALIVRVPKLGKNGLSNEGEPLTLVDAAGLVVSGFPAKPKPKSGVSVVRTTPSAPDGSQMSFALSANTASPAAPNVPLE